MLIVANVESLPPEQRAFWKWVREVIAAGLVDWDSVLRLGNCRYDRVLEATREPTGARRNAAREKIAVEMRKRMDESRDALKPGVRKFFKGRKAVSEAISHTICGWLTMSLGWVPDIEDSCLARFDLTKLAFALAAYRADHGAYPARLADLSPKYAATVPKDRFTDGDLHYSLQGSGYLLYSVGPNGQDDGDRGLEDRKEGSEPWDDIAIRIGKP